MGSKDPCFLVTEADQVIVPCTRGIRAKTTSCYHIININCIVFLLIYLIFSPNLTTSVSLNLKQHPTVPVSSFKPINSHRNLIHLKHKGDPKRQEEKIIDNFCTHIVQRSIASAVNVHIFYHHVISPISRILT